MRTGNVSAGARGLRLNAKLIPILLIAGVALGITGCGRRAHAQAAPGARRLPAVRPANLGPIGDWKTVPGGEEVSLRSDYFFDFGSADLRVSAAAALRSLLAELASRPGEIQVIGHTDGIGGKDYNMTLSLKRAEAVRNWLTGHGIPPARTRPASGAGETGAADGVADWSMRRVDVVVRTVS